MPKPTVPPSQGAARPPTATAAPDVAPPAAAPAQAYLATRLALLRRHGSAHAAAKALERGEDRAVDDAERREALEELQGWGLSGWAPPFAPTIPALVVRGTPPTALGVAIVGARASDPYGIAVARRAALDVAALGRAVVSGGAEGCDAAAHEACVRVGAPTVVVLGGGHLRPYPAAHRPLFEAVVATGGAVLSPFWPPVPPARHRFLRRNEVIAALSATVVVTRARARSGALATARAARAQGCPVLAVPGSVGEGLSEGANGLLARGEATAMTGPGALMRALRRGRGEAPGTPPRTGVAVDLQVGPATWPVQHVGEPAPWGHDEDGQGGQGASERLGLAALEGEAGEAARTVLGALRDGSALDLDALVVQTGLPVAAALAAVAELEVAGAVAREPGPRYRVARRGVS